MDCSDSTKFVYCEHTRGGRPKPTSESTLNGNAVRVSDDNFSHRCYCSGGGFTLDMSKYTHRLDSFTSYPIKAYHPRPSELAALGFYYEGAGDKVRCFSCNVGLCNWVTSDFVMNEHHRWSLGKCRYLNHINSFRQ